MFTNITEEDIRVNCPEYAPMTVKMLNKLNPLKVMIKCKIPNFSLSIFPVTLGNQ